LPFKRPEYFSVPELLISSLAHRAYSARQEVGDIGLAPGFEPNGKDLGFMYKAEARESRTVDLRSTFPSGDTLQTLGQALEKKGISASAASPSMLSEAVSHSVLGIRLDTTGNQPASPLTPALALMQNSRGVLVKARPPDFADILESMFALGAEVSGLEDRRVRASATEMWLKAVDRRLEIDPALRAIDSAMMESVLKGAYERHKMSIYLGHREAEGWAGLFPDTPYSWFHRTWRSLTSDPWVEALPARVWVDWATTVLRLSMGLGFLWEASWYENLARVIVERSVPRRFEELVTGVSSPLPWRSSRATIATRDVASHVKHSIIRGEKARKYFEDRFTDFQKGGGDLRTTRALDFLHMMADERQALSHLTRSMNDSRVVGKLVHETVRYGLQVRKSSGAFTDYYGILRPHGRRWVLVDPGTEWVTVIASLACPGPGKACTVGDVLADLTRLGMRPEIGDLVDLLERAGLARGSADADNAVVVESAF
jgi:hypothetical protein